MNAGRAALCGAVAAAGCNWVPTPYPDPAVAPGGNAPWSHPTNTACDARPESRETDIDGFAFCGRDEGMAKIPIDDPVYVKCADAPPEAGRITVFSVFDGLKARGYVVSEMLGRELVNDDWDGEPLLVDY